MEDGKWKMENGEWRMENENRERRTENGEWKTENGKWKPLLCEARLAGAKQTRVETGNRKQETGTSASSA